MIITKFVLLVTMLLPSGDIVSESSVHDMCPPMEAVIVKYTGDVNDGLILDWRAGCFEFSFNKPTKT